MMLKDADLFSKADNKYKLAIRLGDLLKQESDRTVEENIYSPNHILLAKAYEKFSKK